MNRSLSVKKVKAYASNPDLIKEPTMGEMADLVVLVLTAVQQIEDAIKAGRLDGKTPQPDSDYLSKETSLRLISDAVNKMLTQADSVLSQTSTEIEKRVAQAIANLRNGNDGIVTDEEIQRAAQLAHELIELPDFDELLVSKVQANGGVIRDALESIPEGDEQLRIEAIQGLKKKLEELETNVGKGIIQAGGVSKNTVREMAWNNGNSTTPNTLTVSPTEPTNPALYDLWVHVS